MANEFLKRRKEKLEQIGVLKPEKQKQDAPLQSIASVPLQSIPTKEPIPEASKEKTEKKPRIFTDEQGRPSGVELPDGRTFLGLNPQDINKIVSDFQEERKIPEGAISVSESQRQKEQKQLGIEFAKRIGQLDPETLAQVERGEIDFAQAIGGGLSTAIPGIIGGAVTGAVAGAAGGPITAAGGAVIGGVGAFLVGVRSSLKSQQQQKITAGNQALADGEKVLRKLLTATNKNPQGAAEYSALFNEQLSYIERDFGILKLDTDGFLKDLSGADGTPELANYQRFYDIQRPFYINEFQLALINPDPNKNFISPEDIE